MIKIAVVLALVGFVAAGAPNYNYGYSVADGITGDSKSANEARVGDVVSGQYSLVEPDGVVRTVTYNADPIYGFRATVNRGGAVSTHPGPAPVAPVAVAAVPAPVPAVVPAYAAAGPLAYTYNGAVVKAYNTFGAPFPHVAAAPFVKYHF